MEIVGLRLHAPRHSLDEMRAFYGELLGLPGDPAALSWRVGSARIAFMPADGAPFYHFALLVPGNRFAAAKAWLAGRAELLTNRVTGRTHFDFDFWNAQACYVHDPAGSIVELIAHHGEAERRPDGEFSPAELLTLSEIGLVTADPVATVDRLRDKLGIRLWYGDSADASSLAFVGRKAHTLILCRPGRRWLPTGRPAEIHPVDVTLSDGRAAQLDLSPHHVQLVT